MKRINVNTNYEKYKQKNTKEQEKRRVLKKEKEKVDSIFIPASKNNFNFNDFINFISK